LTVRRFFGFGSRLDQLIAGDEALHEGDFFRASDFQALSSLEDFEELTGFECFETTVMIG
jgi:hypothetical protein